MISKEALRARIAPSAIQRREEKDRHFLISQVMHVHTAIQNLRGDIGGLIHNQRETNTLLYDIRGNTSATAGMLGGVSHHQQRELMALNAIVENTVPFRRKKKCRKTK